MNESGGLEDNGMSPSDLAMKQRESATPPPLPDRPDKKIKLLRKGASPTDD